MLFGCCCFCGCSWSHFSVEISVRGQITKPNRARLKSFAYRCTVESRDVSKLLFKNASKASLLCSYSIFTARKEPSWLSPPPLVVRWLNKFFFVFFFIISLLNSSHCSYSWYTKRGHCTGLSSNYIRDLQPSNLMSFVMSSLPTYFHWIYVSHIQHFPQR